jgi:hypothetical protein
MSDTPITNARWERFCCSGQSWYQIAEEMKLDCRQLERELTAARSEIEAIMETLKSPIEVELDMIRGKIAIPDRSELEYITQLKAVTEQRDKEREIYGKSYSAELTRSNHYKQQRDEARYFAEGYRNRSWRPEDDVDANLLPWETTNQNEL